MAIKGGMPKAPETDRLEREEFIAGGRGKETLPWEEPHVRDDLMVQYNIKIPERLMLQLTWLAQQEKTKQRPLGEALLREGVETRLKRRGITS